MGHNSIFYTFATRSAAQTVDASSRSGNNPRSNPTTRARSRPNASSSARQTSRRRRDARISRRDDARAADFSRRRRRLASPSRYPTAARACVASTPNGSACARLKNVAATTHRAVKRRAASADDDVDAADDAAARAKTLMRSRSTPRARGDMGGGDGGGEVDGEDAFDGARFVVVPPRSRAPDTARISDRYAEAASARDASTPRASGRMDDDEASVVVVTRREWRRDARVDDARDVERRARASDD